MNIVELLNRAVENCPSKLKAATALGIRRQTLDHWLFGMYTPDPWEYSRRIARFLCDYGEVDIDEATVALLILEKKGVSADLLRAIGERAASAPARDIPGKRDRRHLVSLIAA